MSKESLRWRLKSGKRKVRENIKEGERGERGEEDIKRERERKRGGRRGE